MSDAAINQFEEARKQQHDRNEARRMRALVNQARGDTLGAGARWPFELTQNAHDPGARDGKTDVDISLSFDGLTVLYEHDGKIFTMQDLAALLSGGSSKDFEATETTGRFGTGFLVTHVLSHQIKFMGVLAAEGGPENVSILLDRNGDENEIFDNTTHCYQAIRSASKLDVRDDYMTARFEYETDNQEAARIGLSTFHKTLPYLYGTCEHLGAVHIHNDEGKSWSWLPEAVVEREYMGCHLRERRFTVTEGVGVGRTAIAVNIRRIGSATSSLVVVAEQVGEQWQLMVLPDEFPRIFCRFPVEGSDFLPINAVIDGRFDLRQERDRVLMKDCDKEQIADALGLLPTLVLLALEEDWSGGHKLAHMGMPDRAFGVKLDEQVELKKWWLGKLSNVANMMAQIPIVQTSVGLMKAVGESPVATFVMPRYGLRESRDELDFDSVWEVASEIHDVHPPNCDIAPDWSRIASGWVDLGVPLRQVALTEIAGAVRNEASRLDDLKVTTEPLMWLVRFLNLVGKVAEQHNCAAMLSNLLPNQDRVLKSPDSLWLDMGIKNELKDIANAIGHDVRGRLLLEDLSGHFEDTAFSFMKDLLNDQIAQALDEAAVIKECIEELNKQLPDNKPIASDKFNYGHASVDLLKYLWDNHGVEAAQQAQSCPIVASDNYATRWSIQRKSLAPVSLWHISAQPFAGLYESDRILAEDYVTRAAGEPTLVNALVKWNIAFADPLCTDVPRELKDERLKAITLEDEDSTNITVTDASLSQIALLPNQLIQRCQADEDYARLLLGLTLRHVAVHDSSWRDTREVAGRRNRADATVKILPALWLADLRSKAWVPVRGEKDGETVVQPVIADAGNLRPLLDPAWLEGNDDAVELLSRYFGFNALELRLLSTVPSGADRSQVEGELAKIVQALGGDPSKYCELTMELAVQREREEQKERNRRFGLAIQVAIESYLRQRGMHIELIDRGYDYDVYLEAPTLDAGTHHFKLANYLLEVKATTTGEVRLTPAQAQKATEHLDKFILCVVDLRDVTPERLEGEWIPAEVEGRAKIVVQIGSLAGESHGLVEQAKDCDVGIRNDAALRYGVPVSVWLGGMPLTTWVDGLSLPPTVEAGNT